MSKDEALKAWKNLLITRTIESPVSGIEWFGNISEIKLELASIFIYENYKHDIRTFESIFNAPFAKVVGDTERINRVKYLVYKEHLKRNKVSSLTPKKVNELSKQMIIKYPLNIEFFKWFLDSQNSSAFLDLHPGRGYIFY